MLVDSTFKYLYNEKGCNAVLELTLEGIVTNALADAKRAMKAKERNILNLFVSLREHSTVFYEMMLLPDF